MSSAIDYVRYSCGIAGEDVANYVDELEKRTSADTNLIEQLTARVRELEEKLLAVEQETIEACIAYLKDYACKSFSSSGITWADKFSRDFSGGAWKEFKKS